MSLPVSRNTTYVAGASQVKAADLNDLQDAIINNRHGSVPLCLHASAFQKVTGAATLTAGNWVGVGTFVAWLPFDPNTLIDSIEWGYNRGGAGTLTLTLAEMLVLTNTPSSWSPAAIAAGTGYTTSTYTAADINGGGGHATLPANAAWALQIDHTNAANVFGGVKILRTRL